jgi:hypothetical protein
LCRQTGFFYGFSEWETLGSACIRAVPNGRKFLINNSAASPISEKFCAILYIILFLPALSLRTNRIHMKPFKNKSIFLGILAFSALFLSSCKKLEFDKISGTSWNPNLAVPLAHANFGVYDILALQDSNDLVVIDNNTGAIALIYKGEILSLDAQSIVQLPNQSAQENLSLADLNMIAVPAFNGSVTTSNTETINLGANSGIELHTLKFKNGTMNLNLSTDLKHDITLVMTFPELKLNNVPISRTINLNYTGTTPQTGTANVNLADVLADFTVGNTTVNTFEVDLQTTITGTGEDITGSENINIGFDLSNLDFENATGYFGQQNLGIPSDTILLRLFESATQGYFELVNPKVKFIIDNSFGFPAEINFTELKTINVSSGQEYPLTGFPSVLTVNAPAAIGQTATTSLELNTSNTANLSTVISPVPKYFYIEAAAESNPNGPGPTLNFISEDSKFRVRTEIELPLEGLAYGFEMRDTVDFNYTGNVSDIESVMFRLNLDNGFPVDFKTQLVFLDQFHNPLFNVFTSPQDVVKSALVDNTGKVSQSTKKITDISLNASQISNLPNAKYILINGVAQTLDATSGQVVKFYDSYRLKLKLGMQVQGNFGL